MRPLRKIEFGHLGRAPDSFALLLIAGAIVLTIIAGLFLVIGALLGFFVHEANGDGDDLSNAAYLIPALVLLVLILFLLLLLLRSCAGGRKGRDAHEAVPEELAALLPLLPGLPASVRKLADATSASGTALDANDLDAAAANLSAAGAALDEIATALGAPPAPAP